MTSPVHKLLFAMASAIPVPPRGHHPLPSGDTISGIAPAFGLNTPHVQGQEEQEAQALIPDRVRVKREHFLNSNINQGQG